MSKRPDHWREASWEEMAREKPLFAVMTTSSMVESAEDDFTPEMLSAFFAKGKTLYRNHLDPILKSWPEPPEETLVLDYGCGAGRMLRALGKRRIRCAGVDISPTMLAHARKLAPRTEALYALDENGRCSAPDGFASIVYSFAVVQHIKLLSSYIAAFDEMCRFLKPGGLLIVQVKCEDFIEGDFDKPGFTENFETYSLHYRAGETVPYRRHEHDNWLGVGIGQQRLKDILAERGVVFDRWEFYKASKPWAVWVIGRKQA